MSSTFVWIATGMYVAQALVYALEGRYPHVAIMAGYVLANVGIIWSVS